MVKLKKALKKLSQIGSSKTATKSSKGSKSAPVTTRAAKKTSSVKKTAPAGARAKKKAAPPAKKATAKSEAKVDSKSKPAKKPVAAKAPEKAKKPVVAPVTGKAAGKKPEKAPVAVVAAKSPKVAEANKGKKAPLPAALSHEVNGKAKEAKAPAEKPKKAIEAVPEKAATKAAEANGAAQEAEGYDESEIVLTDAEGRRYCRVKECDQIAMVDTYCRYHYLLFWKRIQVRKKILSEGKLERYIEELTARYPDKYLEMLRKDLRTEKEFMAAITELEIDESAVDSEYEDEAQSYLEEVRGMSGEGGGSGREEEEY